MCNKYLKYWCKYWPARLARNVFGILNNKKFTLGATFAVKYTNKQKH